ncbi:haloalkane dehalogenase [Pseudonocardia spinosispora]|uniref:haloalkane dehalogenase n=1 Tax=Pseudonocardia spinosispora TaxID=103441 RepID=UPI00041053B0|nr:haloalkane dehalogenase [Pseudonocardia spinosispora]
MTLTNPAAWRELKQYAHVDGARMAYVEQGAGPAIVLLHGNPTSSFLWRDVVPELTGLGRCLVPDLIGMGDSDKLPADDARRYTFARHREFLDGLLDQVLEPGEPVTFVVHDWGSALGFDWARRHPDRVRGIAYLEAIVRPIPDWEDWPEPSRRVFQGFRSPAGEQMILRDNMFVERVLPGSVLRSLSEEEMDEYRRPFTTPGEDRLPTLLWPRQLPIAGEPADIVEIVAEYSGWLAATAGLPKLFVNAEPGAILNGRQREFCRTWPDQTEVTVPGSHFVQEDSGTLIGQAVADWLKSGTIDG